ncbi:MAG: choice-of-anchor I family protein [Microcoleaceae cyanobacterium MO_207.B10]|nr:choice-of-anchor I family protein [Microcoleaceae cyanobacterium MO_207.B10]
MAKSNLFRIFSLIALLAIAFLLIAASATKPKLKIELLGTYSTGIFDQSSAEISAYDPINQRLFVINGSINKVDILNIKQPNNPLFLGNLEVNSDGGAVNSIAYKNGILAVAVANKVAQTSGKILFFNPEGELLNSVTVGALPDMVKFTPDGNKVLVANEGEPNEDYSIDPEGSVSIIDISNGIKNPQVTTADFSQFNTATLDNSIKISGPNATVAQDLEPEYITVSEDSKTAWITLQENNAIAILNIETGKIEKLVGLGFKDYSKYKIDASFSDGKINLASYKNLFGVYQPDAISSYTFQGDTYLVTANEGDSRQYGDYKEYELVEKLQLKSEAFSESIPNDLGVIKSLGKTDSNCTENCVYERLYTFGGRSFSIWDNQGNLVFDSGDDFEKITAEKFPEFFNSNSSKNNFDRQSNNKGPEPEGVTIGTISDRVYAFIGLERIGGVMTYDVTDPNNPFFVDYVNNRNFLGDPSMGTAGDLGPEGLLFIDPSNSPIGKALLVVTNEVSGTTTIYSVESLSQKLWLWVLPVLVLIIVLGVVLVKLNNKKITETA